MLQLFDMISQNVCKDITKSYSTSFSLAVNTLATSIRQDIYNIYGFVRIADEIVDTFHDFDKSRMLADFERDTWLALEEGISINPVLNAFQKTVRKHSIDKDLIKAFLDSMRMDLEKQDYDTEKDFNDYIYGSADVVGLMCLRVFVLGDDDKYEKLKDPAKRLGSAFQKVNFLRDLKSDVNGLKRSYFPNMECGNLNAQNKLAIIADIEEDFAAAYPGVLALPNEARFGVYTAYRYYRALLLKLKQTSHDRIMSERIRVNNPEKFSLLARSFVRNQLNIL